ncbi:hypothetical protein KZZ52_08310 [Dactylosporangium sp. AC04546]|uniref:hypothetical protein n=1 Tax=Dactylosporangium sp. AC04546 TaxID=2862460 RepID=UPI001EE15049|nr:hypothetical protein [Dactylosporangium sp. AC04546]WVK85379.1 hypothetical protein KZZ52_08310 [Dactylosporangium sp. AC04546]
MLKKLILPLAVAGMLTGCSGGGSTPSIAPTTLAASPEESLPPQTGPAPTKPGASPQAGCPVDSATLEKAFNANAKLSSDIVLGAGLTGISCVQDYATAKAQPTNVDPATVLFHYDATQKMWIALAGGTDGVCDNVVPQAIKAELKNCGV